MGAGQSLSLLGQWVSARTMPASCLKPSLERWDGHRAAQTTGKWAGEVHSADGGNASVLL